MTMIQKITGCFECPLISANGSYCVHPIFDGNRMEFPNLPEYRFESVPEWCPLRKESISFEYATLIDRAHSSLLTGVD